MSTDPTPDAAGTVRPGSGGDPAATFSQHVVGAPRRSLFDAVKPRDVARHGEHIRGPGGMALAALRHEGVTGGGLTPADGVVLAGPTFGSPKDGWVAAEELQALALAYGMAASRSRRTAGGRTWVLVHLRAFAHGPTLEMATLLPGLPPVQLCPIVVGPHSQAARITALLRGIGVPVHEADNDDAWSVLSAMDHTVREAESGAVAVVATRHAGP